MTDTKPLNVSDTIDVLKKIYKGIDLINALEQYAESDPIGRSYYVHEIAVIGDRLRSSNLKRTTQVNEVLELINSNKWHSDTFESNNNPFVTKFREYEASFVKFWATEMLVKLENEYDLIA